MIPDPTDQCKLVATGALTALALLKAVLLFALYAKTAPYPPAHFAPLIASCLVLAVFTIFLIKAETPWFAVPAVAVGLESLLSFGPHKFVIGQTIAIYPAIVTGSALILVLAITGWKLFRLFSAVRYTPSTEPCPANG